MVSRWNLFDERRDTIPISMDHSNHSLNFITLYGSSNVPCIYELKTIEGEKSRKVL